MGFLEPIGLAFSVLLGLLILFHLIPRNRDSLVVPSLRLWQELEEDRLRARRFRPNLLFLLQALALAALIAGLARPYVRTTSLGGSAERHIFIVDLSASMQVREGNKSRFEEVRGMAFDLLDTIDNVRGGSDSADNDEVMLIYAGRGSELALPYTRNLKSIRSALREAAPLDIGGDIFSASVLPFGPAKNPIFRHGYTSSVTSNETSYLGYCRTMSSFIAAQALRKISRSKASSYFKGAFRVLAMRGSGWIFEITIVAMVTASSA